MSENKPYGFIMSLLTASLLPGCYGEFGDPPAFGPEFDESTPADVLDTKPGEAEYLAQQEKMDPAHIDEFSMAVHGSWTYYWSQGSSPVYMGNTSDRFCFLTRVGGKFEGSGEWVQAYISGSGWWLGGSSYQAGVHAHALCIPRNYYGQWLNYTGEYRWYQGNNRVSMGSDANRVCFLTFVRGKFEGGGERVEAYRIGGNWWLSGNSYQSGVAAGARCVNTRYRTGPYHWSQGQSPKIMQAASFWSCGVTKMQGKFEGGGERVNTYVREKFWYLAGSSYQSGVSASGYCM